MRSRREFIKAMLIAPVAAAIWPKSDPRRPNIPDHELFALINECKARYEHSRRAWEKLKAESDLDLRFISGDRWPDAEIAQRSKKLWLAK